MMVGRARAAPRYSRAQFDTVDAQTLNSLGYATPSDWWLCLAAD
jgi:hypothetical protein